MVNISAHSLIKVNSLFFALRKKEIEGEGGRERKIEKDREKLRKGNPAKVPRFSRKSVPKQESLQ